LARFSLYRGTVMRAAIATFGSEVSPRFCCAREVLLVEVEGGRETGRSNVTLGEACNPDRIRLLGSRGVTLLLCGGFNRQFLAEAERVGVHVFWGVEGQVEDAVRALARGEFGAPCRNPGCWCAPASTRRRGGRSPMPRRSA
jgi:predicted Fe-Mo cluster-binding NifX family protein